MWRLGIAGSSNGHMCKSETGVVGPKCTSYVGKYLFHAPQSWADTYTSGRSLLVGYKRSGGGSSTGATIYAFAPWGVYLPENVAGNDTTSPPPDARNGATPIATSYGEKTIPNHYFPYTQLLQYGQSPGGYGESSPHQVDDAAVNTSMTNAAWLTVGSKQAIIFDGNQCYRTFASWKYSYPTNYHPAAEVYGDSEGYHADPCGPVFWFYNVDDITDVALGAKHPYDPQPYSRMDLTPYMVMGSPVLNGMAYDETANRLYVVERVLSPIGSTLPPVIHVFQLSDVGSVFDTTTPPPPVISLSAVSHTAVTFTWSAVTDDSGTPVTYFIYRNGSPIAIQKTVNYTDSWLDFYLSPVEYYVKAVDASGNASISNKLNIDNTTCVKGSCGNAPLQLVIPLNSGNAHETSSLKFTNGETYSFTPKVKGGTAPYTWSASALPSGVSINSSTGEVSGTVTQANGYSTYNGRITVVDANGNRASRKAAMSVNSITGYPSYICDRDQDGMCSNFPGCSSYYGNSGVCPLGGGDTNDFDCNTTTGQTYTQPPPINPIVTGSTGTTVSLSWTAAANRSDLYKGIGGTMRKMTNGLDMAYQVYHGTSPGVYDAPVFVGRNTTYTATGLTAGIHYFAVSAVEFRGLESKKSAPVNRTLGSAITLNGTAYGAYYAEGMDNAYHLAETSDGGIAMFSTTWSYAWNPAWRG